MGDSYPIPIPIQPINPCLVPARNACVVEEYDSGKRKKKSKWAIASGFEIAFRTKIIKQRLLVC